ncbi:hypothetical protein [Streptomyces sp. NPDC004976]
MVIASNGEGLRYVADRGGAIHRSASPDEGEFDRIADGLPQFLDHLRRCVVTFARTGAVGEL